MQKKHTRWVLFSQKKPAKNAARSLYKALADQKKLRLRSFS